MVGVRETVWGKHVSIQTGWLKRCDDTHEVVTTEWFDPTPTTNFTVETVKKRVNEKTLLKTRRE